MGRFHFDDKRGIRIQNSGSLKAFINFVDTATGIEYRDFRLLAGKQGIFVSGPSRKYEKDGETKYIDFVQAAYENEQGRQWFAQLAHEANEAYQRRAAQTPAQPAYGQPYGGGQPVPYGQGYPQYAPPAPAGYAPQPGGYAPQPGGYAPQPAGYPPQPGGYQPPQPQPPAPPSNQPAPTAVPPLYNPDGTYNPGHTTAQPNFQPPTTTAAPQPGPGRGPVGPAGSMPWDNPNLG